MNCAADSLCPLCLQKESSLFYKAIDRSYLRCNGCNLVFVPKVYHLSLEAEHKRYKTHQNDPSDSGYREFLSRLVTPLTSHLKPGWTGLDFGSGPGPTLSSLLGELGFTVENYDPFFDPHSELLEKEYDFITTTEVIEHLRDPAREFQRLFNMVRKNGILAVMTEILNPGVNFAQWYYIKDPTHISFFSEATMNWIADRFKVSMLAPHRNVRLFLCDR